MQSNLKQKPPNPRLVANPVSALFFLYLVPIFWRNFRGGLNEDLFDVLDEHKSSNLGDQLEELWNKTRKSHKKYSLHLALWKTFYKDIIITGIIQGAKEICVIIFMPYAVGELVSYFGADKDTSSKTTAYIFASCIVLCLVIERVVMHLMAMWTKHISMKMRVGCCSLIYRKSLRLSLEALYQTNIGHIINLLSNDVSKFDTGFIYFHYLWIAPLQALIATFILYRLMGVAAFSGMLFILSFVPVQLFLGKRNSMVRLKTAIRTDERVRLMNEVLQGIQIIKMYTWEKPFAKLIAIARRYEIKSIYRHYYIESFMFSLEMFVTRTSIFISIVVYLALGNNINANVAYTLTAIYNGIRPVITIIFSLALTYLGEIHISVLRLEEFLSLPETQITHEKSKFNEETKHNASIFLKNVCVKWSPTSPNNILTDISMDIRQHQLIAVIGPVGSGKTMLLNVLLKELPCSTGSLYTKGTISYASQEAWLFMASVRQNILFGNQYDEVRYQKVVKACSLEQDFKMLPFGERTMVKEKGRSLSGGQKARINLARCIYKDADIYLLDDPLSAVDTKVGKQLYDECITKFLKNKIVVLVTHQLQYLQNADMIIILNNGKIEASGTYSELRKANTNFAVFLKKSNGNYENQDNFLVKSSSSEKIDGVLDDEDEDVEINKEGIVSGGLGFSTYLDYFRIAGNCFIVSVVLVLSLSHAAASGGDYFVSYWMNLEQAENQTHGTDKTLQSRHRTILLYTGIIISTVILALAHSTVFFLFLIKAAKNMHNKVFEKIVCATMNFFNKNPTGRILNRFSKDMGTVDEYIPFILIDVVDIGFMLITTIIISCIVNPFLCLPGAGLVLVLYLIRNIYIRTSRQVKRIEGITRSPMYEHASASINGLTTIRANNAEQTLIDEYDNIQDSHSSAWYLYISSSEAFGLWIDMSCTIFIAIIVFSFLILDTDYHGGDVGLVITLYLGISSLLQWAVFQWSELENNMTSVERILEYTKIETEPKRPPFTNLPRNWPEFGFIIFKNVAMKYEATGANVINDLHFQINSGENLGIVGRTGAGKTSTISALFQFYPITGSIIIDGVDIAKVPLEILRSKISIIPQECVLFCGTIRKNLDPFDEFSDEILWNALEQVEIKSIIEEEPEGLSTRVSEGGSNFSIGQRQLICLARAIIRNNKIIIMDEATANIDSYTDAVIQKTIKNNFANCTIITVAHRLHTVMDSDKVLVMDKGQIVELGIPYILLKYERSIFRNMVYATGTSNAQQLCRIAEENYKLKSSPSIKDT